MSKMSTESARIALNGPTMGTRWSALFFAEPGLDPSPIRVALQAAVDEVDGQMSTWKPDSDLMRLNAAPVGEWIAVPARLREVLRLGLEIGRASGGAFDIGMGDAVTAWGFGPEAAAPDGIRAAMETLRRPAHQALELEGDRIRKLAPIALDLNGIAKGYGVDRLAETLRDHGIADALVGIEGRHPTEPQQNGFTIRLAVIDRHLQPGALRVGHIVTGCPFERRARLRRCAAILCGNRSAE